VVVGGGCMVTVLGRERVLVSIVLPFELPFFVILSGETKINSY